MAFKDRSTTKKTATDIKLADKFVKGADKTKVEIMADNSNLDPKATRTKQIGLKVNQYEYTQLEALANQFNRTVADTMRYAINKVIKNELPKA